MRFVRDERQEGDPPERVFRHYDDGQENDLVVVLTEGAWTDRGEPDALEVTIEPA